MPARKLNTLILVTIGTNALAAAFIAVAIGTNDWFHGVAFTESISIDIKYGLFKGKKTSTLTNTGLSLEHDLYLTCLASKNACMQSCGINKKNRETDIDNIYNTGVIVRDLCEEPTSGEKTPTLPKADDDEGPVEKKFINYGLLICTLLFLSLGIIFIVLGGGLALYNTYRAPIRPILSVFGLYIWNAGAAIFVLIAMIFWLCVHFTILAKNAGISETLGGGRERYETDNATLGFSFWMQLPALLLNITNLVVLKIRAWKIVQMEEKHIKVMNTTLDNGDILLF